MSLLIDQDFVTQADMIAIDGETAEVADAEGLTIGGDGGIVRQAWDECSDELMEGWQAFGGDIIAWPGTLTTYGAFGICRPRLRLNQIVVNSPYELRRAPLYRWMIYSALVAFYRSAASRRSVDRYEKKWNNYAAEVKRRWQMLTGTGLPMVALPLACPGAVHELMAGAWSASNVAAVAGGTMAAETVFDIAITWVDGTQYISPQNTQNCESGPSATVTLTVPAGQVLQVSTTGLNPPNKTSAMLKRGIADGPYMTRTATGWNVYAGPTGGALALQNAAPIPVATHTYTLADAPIAAAPGVDGVGAPMLDGQFPDANYTFMRVCQRG